MTERISTVTRVTEHTEVKVVLRIAGSGQAAIQTGVPFLDHMLALFAHHGTFDLEVAARSNETYSSSLLEDVAFCLGLALDKALGDRQGIARSGHAFAPAEESLVRAVADISGQSFLVYRVRASPALPGAADPAAVEVFWTAFVSQARLNLHIEQLYGGEGLPVLEAVFRAASRALSDACHGP